MNQVKIGKFIQTLRKEQKLTQKDLAARLNVSDKTVSKWETGNGMPEVGLMLPLCDVLGINVNELLSGEKLDEKKYHQRAEENIMSIIREKEQAKKKLILTIVIMSVDLLAGVTIVLLAGFLDMEVWLRVTLIAIAALIIGAGVAVCCVLDGEASVYECGNCGERFVPDMKSFVKGMHTFTRRKLKCPKCGVKSFCKRRLSK